MIRLPFIIASAYILLATGCSMDSCREYSKYTCAQLEKQTYNVYYYDKDARSGD